MKSCTTCGSRAYCVYLTIAHTHYAYIGLSAACHFAYQCSQQEDMCFNCYQRGHQSWACLAGAGAGVNKRTCSRCGEPGHTECGWLVGKRGVRCRVS